MTRQGRHPLPCDMPKLKVAILISGRGSNMTALLDACADGTVNAEVALVCSNRPRAPGLSKAKDAGLATAVVDHREYDGRPAFEQALHAVLVDAGAELVCLAGFMRLLTDGFVSRWPDRLVNIHPSLLPAFKGLDTHQRALDAGVTEHGCTVHFVRPAMDAGPIIGQAKVDVRSDDTADSLAKRVLEQEHRLYPEVLGWIADGRVSVVDEQVNLS